MKLKFSTIFAVLTLILILHFTGESQTVKEGYDKFKGIKTVQTRSVSTGIVKGAFFSLELIANIDEKNDRRYAFSIDCSAIVQNELTPTVIILVDGRREILGRILFYSRTGRNIWTAMDYSFPTTFDFIKRLANAKNIEVQIGSAEFVLGSEFFTSFREFVRRIDSPKRSTPPARNSRVMAGKEVPNEADLESLAQDSLQDFIEAVEMGDFAKFHGLTSKQFKKRYTPEVFKQAFQIFIDRKTEFVPILKSTSEFYPTFSSQPIVQSGVLKFSILYVTRPGPTKLELTYLNEEGLWKLDGLNIRVQ